MSFDHLMLLNRALDLDNKSKKLIARSRKELEVAKRRLQRVNQETEAAKLIQRCWRGYIARREFAQLNLAILKIQSYIRAKIARDNFESSRRLIHVEGTYVQEISSNTDLSSSSESVNKSKSLERFTTKFPMKKTLQAKPLRQSFPLPTHDEFVFPRLSLQNRLTLLLRDTAIEDLASLESLTLKGSSSSGTLVPQPEADFLPQPDADVEVRDSIHHLESVSGNFEQNDDLAGISFGQMSFLNTSDEFRRMFGDDYLERRQGSSTNLQTAIADDEPCKTGIAREFEDTAELDLTMPEIPKVPTEAEAREVVLRTAYHIWPKFQQLERPFKFASERPYDGTSYTEDFNEFVTEFTCEIADKITSPTRLLGLNQIWNKYPSYRSSMKTPDDLTNFIMDELYPNSAVPYPKNIPRYTTFVDSKPDPVVSVILDEMYRSEIAWRDQLHGYLERARMEFEEDFLSQSLAKIQWTKPSNNNSP